MLGDLPNVENNPLPDDDNALLVLLIGTAPNEAQEALQANDTTDPPHPTKNLSHW